jgi:hypothetical protein
MKGAKGDARLYVSEEARFRLLGRYEAVLGQWLELTGLELERRRVYAIDIPGEPGLSEDRRLDWQGPGAEIRLIPGAGHALAGLAPLLLDFLDRRSPLLESAPLGF